MKLNIGSGLTKVSGFTNVDIASGVDATVLPYADAAVEEIYASHVLEHWPYEQTLNVLKEWVRVLIPGGRIRIAVPDLDWIIDAYKRGENHNFEGFLLGGHVNEHDHHRAIFNRDKLAALMDEAGLAKVSTWKAEIQDCSSLPCSLNLQGFKRMEEAKKPKVIAVMTMPRLCFSDNLACVANLASMGITLVQTGGAFWGQGLTRAMTDALRQEADLILTIDYDTLFRPLDVRTLLKYMRDYPEADAICPLQLHRSKQALLMSTEPKVMEIPHGFLCEPMYKVTTGHFGLTLIRANKLRALPKPWFYPTPDENGTWGDGRVDDDMRFWLNWAAAGNTLYAATRVNVGHIVRQVKWVARDLSEIYQSLEDYGDHGKPQGAI